MEQTHVDQIVNAINNNAITNTAYIAAIIIVSVLFVIIAWFVSSFLRRVTQNLDRVSLTAEGSGFLDYGNIIIVSLGLALAFIGFVLFLVVFARRVDVAQAIGFLTAFFGIITGLVGTFFGIKASSDAAAGAGGEGTVAPTVTSVTPPRDATNVPGDTNISASFSKAVTPASISENTFKLVRLPARDPVAGTPELEPNQMTATFTPAPDQRPLTAGYTYQATITTGVMDQEGNALASEYPWQFTIVPPQEQPQQEQPQQDRPPPGRA